MNDPLQALLDAGVLNTSPFPANSRYHGLPLATLERSGRDPVAYVRRRFVPPPERFETVAEHRLIEGERLDALAARYLGDPELYWRIADANGALAPAELTTTPGRRLRITLAEGMGGGGDA